jgi:uncharacterized protein (TIRG00374 family)
LPKAPSSTATSLAKLPDARIVLGTNLVLASAALGWVLYCFGEPALALLGRAPRLPLLGAFVLVVGAGLVGGARRWQGLLAGLGTAWGLAPLTLYRAAAQSISGLVPSARMGGEPVRAGLLARDGGSGASALASVAVDRTLDMVTGTPFGFAYGILLLRSGVPELQGVVMSAMLAGTAILAGIAIARRRLRRGQGLATALAAQTGLDRFGVVQEQMAFLAEAEVETAALVAQPHRMRRALVESVLLNLLVLLEYHLLLRAFGLPSEPLAVVAAIFATGAAHSMPVPAAVGTLEGSQMWLFTMLGHSPEVGLAVGLAVRLRELVWIVPGLAYLVGRWALRLQRRVPHAAAARKPG